jgi:hypothetical protein
VLEVMAKDPAKGWGLSTVKARIAWEYLCHVPRDFVADVMHMEDPDGFSQRHPNSRKVLRVKTGPLGVHERWGADGHDKLNSIGFPVYAFIDDATGYWLGAWVVPNNRIAAVIGYLFLCVVEEYGCMSFIHKSDQM